MVTAFTPAGLHHVFLYRSQWNGTQLCHKVQVSLSNGSPGANTKKKNTACNILSHPTTTFPNPCTLLLCWPSAQSIPEGVSSQSRTSTYVQLWLLSQTVHWKGIRAVAFDFLVLHPLECSWAIVFHKGQNADSIVQAKCKLEKLHIAFLWLTQVSGWKWFPKVTAKHGTKVARVENTWCEGASEVMLRVRTFVPITNTWKLTWIFKLVQICFFKCRFRQRLA